VNARHKPARCPQVPSTFTLRTNSAHPYQNKGFANQNSAFLTSLFSHTCAHSRLQPLCFDMLHKNTRGEWVLPCQHFPPELGWGGRDNRAERSLHSAARRSITLRAGENRAAPVPSTPLGAGGMTAGEGGMTEGERGETGGAETLPDAARNWNFAPSPRTVGIHGLSRREGFHATFCQVSDV